MAREETTAAELEPEPEPKPEPEPLEANQHEGSSNELPALMLRAA